MEFNHLNTLTQCMDLAYRVHDGQVRKFNPVPFIKHPKDVYDMLTKLYFGKLPENQYSKMACAAWLHDTVEDRSEEFPNIKELIEQAQDDLPVLPLVIELTNPSIPFKGRMNRAARKKMDRDHLQKVSWEAKILKMIDRTCNLKDMEGSEEGFRKLYCEESRNLLEVVKDADADLAAILLKQIEILEHYEDGKDGSDAT